MKIIYKYKLGSCIPCMDYVSLPIGAQILSIDTQDKELFLWAFVDTRLPTTAIRYRIVGTGDDLGDTMDDYRHVETLQVGEWVWHMFINAIDVSANNIRVRWL
jgi:hypothetical protein